MGLGIALNVLYGVILILSLVTEPLMDSALHPSGVFYLLALFSFIAVFFVYFHFKESKGLTEKEKKSLYVPEELKEQSKVMEGEW